MISALLLSLILVVDAAKHFEPVIGILTMPGFEISEEPCREPVCDGSHIAAGFVPWLEQAGARVVPMKYDSSDTELRDVFRKVNGVLFTGGPGKPLDNARYFEAAKLLYMLVVDAHRQGDEVPLWGTCLGLQTVAIAAAGSENLLTGLALWNQSRPLDFLPEAFSSRMFSGMSPQLWSDFSLNVTANFHEFGISPKQFAEHVPELIPLATNVANNGETYVSAVEGRRGLPVYAVQFHPEMNQFEGLHPTSPVPSRIPEAIRAMQYLANFFVEQVRKNNHSFDDFAEESLAIVERSAIVLNSPDEGSLYPHLTYSFHPRPSLSASAGDVVWV